MAQPYVGEIRIFAGNFAPVGWEFCHGQVVPISEYETLFHLIGTTYGGDGESTFALPDLQGRLPVHQGMGPGLSDYVLADKFGVEQVTLTTQQIPAHGHALVASTAGGTSPNPTGNVLASAPATALYVREEPTSALPAQSVGATGGFQPHENRMPSLAVNFIISLFGIFPSPT